MLSAAHWCVTKDADLEWHYNSKSRAFSREEGPTSLLKYHKSTNESTNITESSFKVALLPSHGKAQSGCHRRSTCFAGGRKAPLQRVFFGDFTESPGGPQGFGQVSWVCLVIWNPMPRSIITWLRCQVTKHLTVKTCLRYIEPLASTKVCKTEGKSRSVESPMTPVRQF